MLYDEKPSFGRIVEDLKLAATHEAGHLHVLRQKNITSFVTFSLAEKETLENWKFCRCVYGSVSYEVNDFAKLTTTEQRIIGLAGLAAELFSDDLTEQSLAAEIMNVLENDPAMVSNSDKALIQRKEGDVTLDDALATSKIVIQGWKDISKEAESIMNENLPIIIFEYSNA
ncbi:hypothetical protein C9J27_04490 [Photobacterium kishitanii]|uniref:Peptidase M41 domain-containing protein n=2 Tax=Photobacterium kishitanii TaxID=318456 RepID=A0A2T3KL07_9GAMM|nr:hypothetical protein C9J27_04490 [Photobacterium kishitanii]